MAEMYSFTVLKARSPNSRYYQAYPLKTLRKNPSLPLLAVVVASNPWHSM